MKGILKKMVYCTVMTLAAGASALDIVRDGKSDYVIYHDPKAPKSVIQGAKELQDYCKKVTGYVMPIAKKPAQHMISLGENKASKAAKISAKGIELEGFAVVVRDGSVYIIGEDTPDGRRCKGGGVSNGTRNGVYTFLEKCFGVRWLMPGPYGEYYPEKKTVSVPDEGFKEEPGFLNRRLPYIQEFSKMSQVWSARQKLGFSLYINSPHNWKPVCPPEMFDKHPEWYAMIKGKREYPVGRTYKLCITNPSTIQRFIDYACDYFKKHPNETTFSLSPSDGSHSWCECENCTKLYEKNPHGALSVTPAILNFYNEVTKGVRAKYPDRYLGGEIYSRFLYPPKKPIKLADGLVISLAPHINYSYKLYRESSQKDTDYLLDQWEKCTTNINYYDLPMTWWRNGYGCVNGPALELMKFIYPRLANRYKKGIYIYGAEAWGHTGVTNYMLAKLAWNPSLDIDALFKEYCDLAYAEASPEMQQIYHLADKLTKEYILNYPKHGVQVEKPTLKMVALPMLPQISKLFKQGVAKVKGDTPNSKRALQRLEYFRNNMKILQWTLKDFKLLPENYSDPIFDATDDEIASFYNPGIHRIAYFNRPRDIPRFPSTFKKFGDGVAIPDQEALAKKPAIRGPKSLIFKAKADGELKIKYTLVGKKQMTNKIYFFDDDNKLIQWRFLRNNNVITLPVKAGKIYRAQIVTLYDAYRLEVENAWWGVVSEIWDEGVNFLSKRGNGVVAIIYLYVPEGTKSFQMWLRDGGDSKHLETAKGVLNTPKGRKIVFDVGHQICDRKEVEVREGEAGFWKLEISKSDRGVIEDYHVRILSGIPPILFPDAANAFKTK